MNYGKKLDTFVDLSKEPPTTLEIEFFLEKYRKDRQVLLIALAAASFFFLFFIGYPFALSRDLMSVFLGSFLASFLVYMAIYVSTSNDFDLKIKKNKEAFFDFEHHPEIQQAIYKIPEIAAYIERVAAQSRLLTVAEADAIESAFNKFNAEKRMIIIGKAAQGVLERKEATDDSATIDEVQK